MSDGTFLVEIKMEEDGFFLRTGKKMDMYNLARDRVT